LLLAQIAWLPIEGDPSANDRLRRKSRIRTLMQKGADPWQAAGYQHYGHHHPDYLSDAVEKSRCASPVVNERRTYLVR
jgi:hypothetical protein